MTVKNNQFQLREPSVLENTELRVPQIEAFVAIREHDFDASDGREVGVVLPVGCGKSGLLAIAPFAVKAQRALLVAPNVRIAGQLLADLNPSSQGFFYVSRRVLDDGPYPEAAELRGSRTNLTDLDEADVVVTNIQQLQREDNRWLENLPDDYFDLIMFDEAHHNVATSWETLRTKFPNASIINVSATPQRADGRAMSGSIIYSYPISEAVKQGYVKRISGHRLNPKTLKYIRLEGEQEIEVTLDEVRELGEKDAGFRRSIVSSKATLDTIVDASIRKLNEQRTTTGDKRLKIIASALNQEHCKQIVAAYAERGLRADFVHSKEDSKANERVHAKLENNELDVIVQVRMLGEGFDHPYLSVAAVFSIFANLGPFVQFVGRIMRVIPGTARDDKVNDGVVVFHVGGNVTGVWNDFQEFAEADQQFFMNLVDEHLVEDDVVGEPSTSRSGLTPLPVITDGGTVLLEDIQLLKQDPDIAKAIRFLKEKGLTTGEQFEQLASITPSKQATRQAKRTQLDGIIKTRVGQVLAKHGLVGPGRELDKSKSRENFVVIKSAIDLKVAAGFASDPKKKRADFTSDELDRALSGMDGVVAAVETELF